MPSRSPFVMSTDTGIQVEFDRGNTTDTGTSLTGTSVALSGTAQQDQFVLAFGAGRDIGGELEFTNSNVHNITVLPSVVYGPDTRIVLNDMASCIVDTSTSSLSISSEDASDGVAMAIVAIDNGYDVTTATNDLGNTASLSNVSTSDLIFIWETYTHSSTATAPALPSGFTNIGSGTFATGRGGNVYEASYRLSYKENASGTVSYTAQSSGTNNINAGGVTLVRVQRILKDYELSSYGSPDYTITSFPSTGTGVASGQNDLLVAVDTTIDYASGAGDEGLFLEMGGTGSGFAWGLDNGTTMRARAFDGGGNFRDGGADALAAADLEVNINEFRNRQCTFYIRVDHSATNIRLYVQIGGQGSSFPIRSLSSNTSNGAYTNHVYGSAGKGYGQVNGVVPDLVGSGGTGAYEDNYTGTIDEIRYWGEAGAPNFFGFSSSYDTV